MELWVAVVVFSACSIVIVAAGIKLTKAADTVADITGLGEAIMGAVFLGAVTSLSGIMTSVTAAWQNHPELAISNALGGIAAQTTFLAIADIYYPNVNLEHASASLPNIMQGLLLIILLTLVSIVPTTPEIAIWAVHPVSVGLFIVYAASLWLIRNTEQAPMWEPEQTIETVRDVPDEKYKGGLKENLVTLIISATIVAFAGYWIAQSGIAIAQQTGMSEGFVGTLFTGVATSLPELVVAISAVRQKSVTMAVANVLGGNTFDVLFVAFSDIAYRDGSIYHRLAYDHIFIMSLTILLTSLLVLGLLHRQKFGIANIGWESFLVLVLYVSGNVLLYFMG